MEIARLEALLEERQPILVLINKHRELIDEKEQLAASSNDSSRLMARGSARDPTRLLREEKMRKRIAKELPRIEVELKRALEKWEDDYGEPLLVHGENYLDTLMRLSPVAMSRAASTKSTSGTGTGAAAGTRGRSNTMSSLGSYGPQSTQRAKSRPNIKETTAPLVKPPMRSKTPTARPKTPAAAGTLYSNSNTATYSVCGASTLGRSSGRSLASAMGDRGGRSTPAFQNAALSLSRMPPPQSHHHHQQQQQMAAANGSPTRANSQSKLGPSRMGPPATTTSSTLGRNASVKRKLGPGAIAAAPKMQQLHADPTKQQQQQQQMTPYARHQFEQQHEENTRPSCGGRSIRSVSPYGSESHYSTYSDSRDEDRRNTPRANTYRPNPKRYLEYDSSARGSQTSRSDTRDFSSSSASTISSLDTPGNSGSENWETFGAESEYGDDADPNPREEYYRQKVHNGYVQEKSIGLVRDDDGDNWRSETAY